MVAGKVRLADRYETHYGKWSRIYEHPLVIDRINKYGPGKDISTHNSFWGFEEVDADHLLIIHNLLQ